MLLSKEEFQVIASQYAIMDKGGIAVDFETNGLSVYHGARAFILGFCGELGTHSVWCSEDPGLQVLFGNPKLRYAAHSAKFELGFLREQFGVNVAGDVWDTEVMDRVLYNNHMRYGLQQCAERRGMTKHVPMLEWLKVYGPKYHEAPDDLIIPYVEQDAKLSYDLMNEQIEMFKHWDTGSKTPIRPVVRLECKTTKTLFDMESRGLLLNEPYAREAMEYETRREVETAREFKSLTGCDLVDSRKSLSPIFDSHGIPYGKTDKGNSSFSAEALLGAKDHPIVRCLFQHRDAVKRCNTYWQNFLSLVTPRGKIHPNIHQTEAKTSRMSVRNPACQTWPDDSDDTPYPVRRAFVASSGCKIVSMDWSQMELRLICDEAEEMGMIESFKSGFDFHQQVADLARVPRSIAKNGRFAKLYGAGDARISATLGVPLEVAQRVSRIIDDTSPKVAQYSYSLIRYAKKHKMGFNWLGRRYFFDKGFEYKMPNYRIQGGCGEILRIAICDVDDFLAKNARPETRILLPIHDELVFNWRTEDLHLIPQVKELMIKAHRSKKHLDMDVSITIGDNFFDQEIYAV